MRNKLILTILLLLQTICFLGQKSGKLSDQIFLNLEGITGNTWAHHKSINYLLEYPPYAINLDIGLHSGGKRAWQHDLAMPRYGIGYQFSGLGSSILGNAHSVYLFIHSDFIKRKHFQWHYKIGAGIGFIDNPYDPEKNPLNVVNGSVTNAFLRMSSGVSYQITTKSTIGVNAGLFHLSNGNTSLPNWGINTLYLSANYTYQFADTIYTIQTNKAVGNYKSKRITIYGSGGFKEERPIDKLKYIISDIHINYWRKYRPAFSWGAGLTVFYDESTKKILWKGENEDIFPLSEYQIKNIEYWAFGAQVGYMLNMHPIYFSFEFGAYLYTAINRDIFNRWLLEIQVTNNLRVYGGLKSRFGRADFIEYGLAYDIFTLNK